ncbi:hypothetical protein RvY_06207-2 [Ramazzottius varieornatus]|uniref:Uncharacterized protein n=1 Tax=Ramazzottius varieornatus TaxID=947166 RepID=A0A1D1V376_RAMVA|nr:hypothetical protein RvY_06207-2 [Ramazzottius varieornatus]
MRCAPHRRAGALFRGVGHDFVLEHHGQARDRSRAASSKRGGTRVHVLRQRRRLRLLQLHGEGQGRHRAEGAAASRPVCHPPLRQPVGTDVRRTRLHHSQLLPAANGHWPLAVPGGHGCLHQLGFLGLQWFRPSDHGLCCRTARLCSSSTYLKTIGSAGGSRCRLQRWLAAGRALYCQRAKPTQSRGFFTGSVHCQREKCAESWCLQAQNKMHLSTLTQQLIWVLPCCPVDLTCLMVFAFQEPDMVLTDFITT